MISASRLALGLSVTLLLTAVCLAQVESHMLPDTLGDELLPDRLAKLPSQNSRVLSVAVDRDAPTGAQSAAPVQRATASELLGIEGQTAPARVTKASDMAKAVQQVTGLVEQGKFTEATKQGEELLRQKKTDFDDFTWDYLGNAVAWAYLRQGDFDGAARAHRAAGARVNEATVRGYHSRLGELLERAVAKDDNDTKARELAAELGDPEKYRLRIRKELLGDVKRFNQMIGQMDKAKDFDGWLNHAKRAYSTLRYIYAMDAEVGGKLCEVFARATDAMVTSMTPDWLDKARKQQLVIVKLERQHMNSSDAPKWNDQVRKLWGFIQETKRACRVHDFLARRQLAGSVDVAGPFGEAHALLFVPEDAQSLYKTTGQVTGGVLDMTLRKPADEVAGPVIREAQRDDAAD